MSGTHVPVDSHQAGESAHSVFHLLYRLIGDIQRVRITHNNRMRQVLPLIPTTVNPPRNYKTWSDYFSESAVLLEAEEQRLFRLAKKLLAASREGQWLLAQKGIGPALGVSILGECEPLSRFASPRRLFAYAGLHVGEDGRAVKRKKGQKANWNGRLKTRLWIFVGSALKAGGPWADLYYARKQYEYSKSGPQCALGVHGMLEAGLHPGYESQPTTEAGPPQGADESRRSFEEAGISQAPHESQRTAENAGLARIYTESHGPSERAGDTQEVSDNQASFEFSRLHLHNRAVRFVMKRLLRELWCVANGNGSQGNFVSHCNNETIPNE